jgi:hypothetical protein
MLVLNDLETVKSGELGEKGKRIRQATNMMIFYVITIPAATLEYVC